jgi:hypothetical protein
MVNTTVALRKDVVYYQLEIWKRGQEALRQFGEGAAPRGPYGLLIGEPQSTKMSP